MKDTVEWYKEEDQVPGLKFKKGVCPSKVVDNRPIMPIHEENKFIVECNFIFLKITFHFASSDRESLYLRQKREVLKKTHYIVLYIITCNDKVK